jgi:hypothetical protein
MEFSFQKFDHGLIEIENQFGWIVVEVVQLIQIPEERLDDFLFARVLCLFVDWLCLF